MRRYWKTITVAAAMLLVVGLAIQARSAEETTRSAPLADVERIMGLIGNGKIDEAMTGNDFLKNEPDGRQAIRAQLIGLRDSQQHYYGYDVAAVQRFSPRLQTVWVLAYYDQRPVLMHMQFYRPTGRADEGWTVLDFRLDENFAEVLKDVPVDYPGHAGAPAAPRE
jgi:hypothetical protein